MKGTSPFCGDKLFVISQSRCNTRSLLASEIPLRKNNLGQESISFIVSSIWNKLSNDLKDLNTTTSLIHGYKSCNPLQNYLDTFSPFAITSLHHK